MKKELLAINGGKPCRTVKWPTYEDGTKLFSSRVKILVNQVLDSGYLFRYDNRSYEDTTTGIFENKLKEFFGCKYALAVSSGTTSIALALMSLNLPKGFLVACPTFGFPATTSAVLLAGGEPRLFACDENLYYDLDDLKFRWSDEIKVLIVVHMRGFAQPIDKLISFARSKNVYIIEDAVPSLGVCANGKLLGTYGDIGCFSTQSDKTIVTGEGGFLITDNKDFFEKAILLSGAFESRIKHHGIEIHEEWEKKLPLFSFRMDEIRAAIAIPQLENINEKVKKLQANYCYIVNNLSNIYNIRIRASVYEDGYLGESLIFFVDESRAQWVADAITAEGITARCFGNFDNARSFEQWKFLDELGLEEFYKSSSILMTKKYLSSAIDISLSYNLEINDLNDLIMIIQKVMTSV
jgi:dTDP-4-amino-4,6-dideoxygalactose transaminase